MEATTLACALLSCGYLDAEYLLCLIDTCDLELADLVSDVAEYLDGTPTVNDLIGASFERVAQTFLTHVVKRRATRFTSTDYTVWTNCMDS